LYAGTFIPHGRKPADWNIALQVVQLSVQAVERTLDKTALLVLTKEELITWLASGKLIVQKNQSYESYKIRIRSLLIVFPAKTRSAKLPLYISQRIALVVSCPYISKKRAAWVIRPRSGAATLKATGAPSQDGPFTRHRILVPTILDLLNSEQPLGQLDFGARSTDKIAYQSQALAI
jgi:hypothetical protein